MKRFTCIAIVLLFLLCGCGDKPIEVGEFSYTAFCEYYNEDVPWIKHEGFVNTEKNRIETAEQAVQLAKKECTVEYDTIDVSYDNEEKMYLVMFSMEGWVGGDQSVCINHEGITKLIVYGE